jgi:hypothetical protein
MLQLVTYGGKLAKTQLTSDLGLNVLLIATLILCYFRFSCAEVMNEVATVPKLTQIHEDFCGTDYHSRHYMEVVAQLHAPAAFLPGTWSPLGTCFVFQVHSLPGRDGHEMSVSLPGSRACMLACQCLFLHSLRYTELVKADLPLLTCSVCLAEATICIPCFETFLIKLYLV